MAQAATGKNNPPDDGLRRRSKPPGSQPGKVVGANHRKEVKKMMDNKKPSEPSEAERWAKRENELQKLKRSNLLLSFGFLLLAVLYGFMIFRLGLRVNRITDILGNIICTERITLQILEIIKNFLF